MKGKKILKWIIVIIPLLIIGTILFMKYYAQVNYAANTEETKEELSSDLPICVDGEITAETSNEVKEYQPDELMGSIYIPTFDLTIPLYMENDDDESNWVLELGVAMDDASSYPYGEESTVVFGHRHYDFQYLEDIKVGDGIAVTIGDNVYVYEVTSTEIIGKDEAEKVFTDKNELVLYTCYPFIWGAPTEERFTVHASPVDSIEC